MSNAFIHIGSRYQNDWHAFILRRDKSGRTANSFFTVFMECMTMA